jgi:hypothetical protein
LAEEYHLSSSQTYFLPSPDYFPKAIEVPYVPQPELSNRSLTPAPLDVENQPMDVWNPRYEPEVVAPLINYATEIY